MYAVVWKDGKYHIIVLYFIVWMSGRMMKKWWKNKIVNHNLLEVIIAEKRRLNKYISDTSYLKENV